MAVLVSVPGAPRVMRYACPNMFAEAMIVIIVENRLAVPAQAERRINEQAPALGREVPQRLSKQHGAMGRARPPTRHSHHHRPVVSFKEQFTICRPPLT